MLLLSSALAATLEVPQDYPTIQAAIDEAVSGDFVEVYEGTYTEDLVVDVDIEIGADGGQVEIIGAHVVSENLRLSGLDFTGKGKPCFQVTAEELSIAMSQIVGCSGAIVATGTDLYLQGVSMNGNSSYDGPGGVDLVDGSLLILDSEISGNNTTYGTAGAIAVVGEVTVESALFSGNAGYNGAGALQVTGDLSVSDSTFSDNGTTYGPGGAVVVTGGDAFLQDAGFRANRGYNGGGCLAARSGGLEVVSTTFEDCTTTYGTGGAIDWTDGTALVLDGVVATHASSQTGGGLVFAEGSSVEIRSSTFHNGSCTYGSGGGVHVDATTADLHLLWFENNTAPDAGGGLYVDADQTTLTNSVFYANTTTYTGGGAYVAGNLAEVVNNDFLENVGGHADNVGFDAQYAEFVNNIVAGAATSPPMVADGSVDEHHNAWFDNLADTDFPGDGDVNEDCLFVSYPDDLHLAEGSPCIDAGWEELSDPDGSVSDIGAFGGPGAPWEGSIDTGLTEDSGDDGDDTGLDGDDTNGSGVRAFCGCGSASSAWLLLLLGVLALRREN